MAAGMVSRGRVGWGQGHVSVRVSRETHPGPSWRDLVRSQIANVKFANHSMRSQNSSSWGASETTGFMLMTVLRVTGNDFVLISESHLQTAIN